MKKNLLPSIVLGSICLVVAVLLSVVNSFTAPIIKENQDAAANEALLQVMPDGEGFEKIEDLSAYTLPSTVTEVYREKNGGFVVTLTTAGYGSDMVIMCGVDANGNVTGAVCLSSNETLGHEKTFGEKFTGKDAAGVDAVDTISGATKTTAAYKNAIKDALNTAIILGGGEVDIRDEAQILLDNLSAALPAAEGKFSKPFLTEVLPGIDAVWEADNGKGWVYVIGEEFIPVDASGNTANKTVADAHAILSASTLTDLDLSAFQGLPEQLISAKKTATGNFVLEINAAGYGINGGNEYHPASGKYIVIRVSMTADGKIIDTLTVSQEESKGFGDACADEKFYGQFDGKTEADYTKIDAISGATMTTGGYLKAIERAFASVKILKGGSN
jgi:electron transport complex protein RnfG